MSAHTDPQPTLQPASRLDLEARVDGSVGVISLRGDVDHATAPELRRVASGLLAVGAADVELDCGELSFFDSGGVAVLVELLQHTGSRGGTVRLVSPQPAMRRLLQVTGLDELVSLA